MTPQSIRRLLVFAVGGGNGGISSLWLLKQLRRNNGLNPETIDLLCMLPDGVDYHEIQPAQIDGLSEVASTSYRKIGGERVRPFPESILAAHKSAFGIRRIYGAHLTRGSAGLCQTLRELIARKNYDLLLAVDTGGGLIATDENTKILSPMMDACAGFALQKLQAENVCQIEAAVMGLGADGESTPAMIDMALVRAQPRSEGVFEAGAISNVTRFYQDIVRPKRRSLTGDLMIEALSGGLKKSYPVTCGFHVRQWMGTRKFTAEQRFELETRHACKYYLFDRLERIGNRFFCECRSSREWLRMTQDPEARYQHELVNLTIEGGLIATPSWMFPASQREEIFDAVKRAIKTGHYEKAFVYPQDYDEVASRRTEGKVFPLDIDVTDDKKGQNTEI